MPRGPDETDFFEVDPPLEAVEGADQAGSGPVRDADARVARLSEGADEIRDRRGSFIERTGVLVIASGVLVTLGLSLIVVAWVGTSRSIHVEEQIPYVVSGGILGATLAIVGALCLFTHWLTVGIRESRARELRAQRRHDELLEALSRRSGGPDTEGGNNGHAHGGRRQRPLRSAPRGS